MSADAAPPPELGEKSSNEAFGSALCRLATDFPKLVVLDSGSAETTGLHQFRRDYPDRFFQFGPTHQNMIGAANGLAAVGLLPVVSGHAAFFLRGMEQVRLALASLESNVKIVASHAGLDAATGGAPLQALEDIAAFRVIPGMTVISPADPAETGLALRAMLELDGPVYMRLGSTVSADLFGEDHKFDIGKGEIVRNGADVTIVACGVQLARALEAAILLEDENIDARVVNLAPIKPNDAALLTRCADVTGAIVTTEDHNILGGLGSAVAEVLAQSLPCPIEFIGSRDTFA